MFEPAQAQFACGTFDKQLPLDGIEQAHALRIQRVSTNRILSREQRQVREAKAKSESIGVDPFRRVVVGLADRTMPMDTPGARPSGECSSPLTSSMSPIL